MYASELGIDHTILLQKLGYHTGPLKCLGTLSRATIWKKQQVINILTVLSEKQSDAQRDCYDLLLL